MELVTNCPQCPRHCPVDALSCGRGRAYFQEEEDRQEDHPHGEHGHGSHGHEKHGHTDRSSLYGLMRICGHALFHKCDEKGDLFSALTADEQEQLKALLTKLADSWEP